MFYSKTFWTMKTDNNSEFEKNMKPKILAL